MLKITLQQQNISKIFNIPQVSLTSSSSSDIDIKRVKNSNRNFSECRASTRNIPSIVTRLKNEIQKYERQRAVANHYGPDVLYFCGKFEDQFRTSNC